MNKIILLGRLANDPESNNTTSGKFVCKFRLAVNRRKRDEVDFFPIVAWEKTGEFCNGYFAKGQQIAVVGRLQTRSYDDSDGKKKWVTEVVAEEVFFADGKKSEDAFVPGDAFEGDFKPPF